MLQLSYKFSIYTIGFSKSYIYDRIFWNLFKFYSFKLKYLIKIQLVFTN